MSERGEVIDMAQDRAEALAAEVDRLRAVEESVQLAFGTTDAEVLAEYAAELQNLRRYTPPVAQGPIITRSGTSEECPWCGTTGDEHSERCPAFTPEGEVR